MSAIRFSSAPYPAHLTTSWSLGLAHSITVRPIRPEDADMEIDFARGLSSETRYNRFLGGGITLTPEWLDRLVRIDFSRDMALIATVTLDEREAIIGVARYARLEDSESCEFAITIADAWQGRGIGCRLMKRLIECACAAGLSRIIGEVLATNIAMLRLARSLGFLVEIHPQGAELRRVILELRKPGPCAPSSGG